MSYQSEQKQSKKILEKLEQEELFKLSMKNLFEDDYWAIRKEMPLSGARSSENIRKKIIDFTEAYFEAKYSEQRISDYIYRFFRIYQIMYENDYPLNTMKLMFQEMQMYADILPKLQEVALVFRKKMLKCADCPEVQIFCENSDFPLDLFIGLPSIFMTLGDSYWISLNTLANEDAEVFKNKLKKIPELDRLKISCSLRHLTFEDSNLLSINLKETM